MVFRAYADSDVLFFFVSLFSLLSCAQFIQTLISTYTNDKLLRSKFSSPEQVK